MPDSKIPTTGSSPDHNVFASATKDGVVTPSDTTVLDFNSLYVPPGVSGTVTIQRRGVSSPAYPVLGPFTLCVAGDRVMSTGTTLAGGSLIWQKW